MNVKDFYGKLKSMIRCNPDYKVVNESYHELIDIQIDDEHKEIVLKFIANLQGEK